MNILLPLKYKKVPDKEPPWVNKKLKSHIHDCHSALSRGDTTNFRHLRNSVNRYRKSYRAKYYAAKVEHLRDCEPRRWWKEVKKIAGMQSAIRTDVTSLLCNINPVPNPDLTVLANTINDTFLATMNKFATLDPQVHQATQHVSNPPTVTEHSIYRKLASLNPTKSLGARQYTSLVIERERRYFGFSCHRDSHSVPSLKRGYRSHGSTPTSPQSRNKRLSAM